MLHQHEDTLIITVAALFACNFTATKLKLSVKIWENLLLCDDNQRLRLYGVFVCRCELENVSRTLSDEMIIYQR